jgi:hypothetical protein
MRVDKERGGPPMEGKVPQPLWLEHEELLAGLAHATTLNGRVGAAAKAVTALLHSHAEKEEAYALPPLGLLPQLAAGAVTPEMGRVLAQTDLLKANLAELLAEHRDIVAALMDLIDVAKVEGAPDCAHLAQQLILHAQTEEEVFYPTTILIGEYLRLRLHL